MNIEEKAATTYCIRNIEGGGWADITIRSWEGGGALDCQSDFGNFAYQWGSIGERTFLSFLCGLDMDYFLKKTRPKDYRIFSTEKTCNAIRKHICRDRREYIFEEEEARCFWEEVDNIDGDGPYTNAEQFMHEFLETETMQALYAGDPCSVEICFEYHPICLAFWERAWLPLVESWKRKGV